MATGSTRTGDGSCSVIGPTSGWRRPLTASRRRERRTSRSCGSTWSRDSEGRRSRRSTTRRGWRSSRSCVRRGCAAKTGAKHPRTCLRLIFKLAVRSGAWKRTQWTMSRSHARTEVEMVFLEPEQIMELAGEVAKPPACDRRGERRVDGCPEYDAAQDRWCCTWRRRRRSDGRGRAPARWRSAR